MTRKIKKQSELEYKARPKPSLVELAYMAGFFDGEGCINICAYKHKHIKNNQIAYKMSIKASQVDVAPLLMFHKFFGGGTPTKFYQTGQKSGIVREQHLWGIGCNAALHCLEALVPYLIVKKEEAEIAIRFQRGMILHSHTDSKTIKQVSIFRKACFEGVKNIKRNRGLKKGRK